jgi:hypothetical protein
VFVVKPAANKEDEARSWLTSRLGAGLPIPAWAVEGYALGDPGKPEKFWRRCPFVPENGWGEFALDPALPVVNGRAIEVLQPPRT